MEFFKLINNNSVDVAYLKTILSIKNLTKLSTLINSAEDAPNDKANIYCLWRAFNISREELKYGVRFSLLNCPHALAWTTTYDRKDENIIIHCTTDKSHHDVEFSDSIEEFIDDWKTGIINQLSLTK